MHSIHVRVGVSLVMTTMAVTVCAAEPPTILPEASLVEVCAEQALFAAEVASMRDEGLPVDVVTRAVEHVGTQVGGRRGDDGLMRPLAVADAG